MLDEPGVRALETLLLDGTRLSDAMADHPTRVRRREARAKAEGTP